VSKLTLYAFEAYDPKRHAEVRGTWFAPSEQQARFWLESQGYSDIKLKRTRGDERTLRVHPTALALFFRQLGVLLQSSTPLPFALRLVSHSDDLNLSGVARRLESDVSSGMYLSQAMATFPRVFGSVTTGLVAAGENSGRLAQTLLDIAETSERQVALRSRVIASLTYPLVLAGFTLLVTGVFLFYVLPLDNELFGSMGIELPAINRLLISLSQLLKSPWFTLGLFLVVAALGLAFRRQSLRNKATELLLRGLEKFALTRELMVKGYSIRMLAILNLVLGSGGSVESALKLMLVASDRPQRKQALIALRERVVNGASFGEALEACGFFPRIVNALLKVGYETAQLDKMTQRAMEICEEDVNCGLDALTSLIEPLFMAMAGALAAFAVITAALPMLKLLQNL
jgi:type II secretory pathway component PulF